MVMLPLKHSGLHHGPLAGLMAPHAPRIAQACSLAREPFRSSGPHLWVVGQYRKPFLSLRHRPAYAILLSGVVLAIASRVLL